MPGQLFAARRIWRGRDNFGRWHLQEGTQRLSALCGFSFMEPIQRTEFVDGRTSNEVSICTPCLKKARRKE